MDVIDRINTLLAERGITGADLSRGIGVSNSVYSQWNTKTTSPSRKNLVKVATYLQTTVGYLLGDETKEKAPAPLNARDERDVARRLEDMLDLMSPNSGSLMFDGEPLDDETRELLRAGIKNQLEMSKRLAKQKYTPKKYRKSEGE